MSEHVNEMTEVINSLIKKQIGEIRDRINHVLNENGKVSEKELSIITDRFKINGDVSDVNTTKHLRDFAINTFNCSSQSEILKLFRSFMSHFSEFSSFFIIKQGKAVCFDVFPENHPVKKGYTFDSVVIKEFVSTLDKTPLAKHLSQINASPTNIYVFPIFLKYKPAGYIVCDVKNVNFVDTILSGVSILSRELTLLPAKPKEQPVAEKVPEKKPVKEEPSHELTSTPSSSFNWDESVADRAKRYAKLLVSEIILYNEKLVIKGRQEGKLKTLLDADIERSFDAFRERFSDHQEVPDQIFEQALVQYLAEGNPQLL